MDKYTALIIAIGIMDGIMKLILEFLVEEKEVKEIVIIVPVCLIGGMILTWCSSSPEVFADSEQA